MTSPSCFSLVLMVRFCFTTFMENAYPRLRGFAEGTADMMDWAACTLHCVTISSIPEANLLF
jgi:hypothetical protein